MDGFVFRSDDWQPGYRPTDADKRHVSDLYEGELFDLDALVARFLAGLELERGGTAVLVTSDHGEGLGEEGTWNHDDVREVQVRVPLLLRLPEPEPRPMRVDVPVSGIDVAPTLLALAGVPVPPDMEGRDLLALRRGETRERWVDDRDHVLRDEHRCALYRGDFKLVRFGGASARYELYDLATDPAGFTDVKERHPELFAELVARMDARTGAVAPIEGGATGAASAAALQALGYAGD
jgi:arylsulfatase A-like enzyme